MLSKLFRYEMRYSSPILLFLHGFLLLGALVLFGIRHLPESLPVSVITAVGSIFCILLAAVFAADAAYSFANPNAGEGISSGQAEARIEEPSRPETGGTGKQAGA